MQNAAMAAQQPEVPSLTVPQRLFGALFNPKPTFADIVRRPSFLPPLIVLIVFSLASSIVIVRRIGIEQIVRSEVMKSPQVADLPAERREEIIERGVAVARFTVYAAPLVFTPLAMLVIAAALLLMANFVLGAETNYKTLLSTTAYGMMPACVVAILGIITVFLKEPSDVDVQNLVISHLGPLFDPGSHKVLNRLASSLDLFSFWQIALLALGVSAAARFSFRKGLVAVMVPWAVWVLGAAGFRALF